jgi:hypothetical protein
MPSFAGGEGRATHEAGGEELAGGQPGGGS